MKLKLCGLSSFWRTLYMSAWRWQLDDKTNDGGAKLWRHDQL